MIQPQNTANPGKASIQRFARQLRVVRRRAGDPSFRTLARGTEFSVSTLTRAMRGETFPRWAVVEDLLDACHADVSTRAAIKQSWYAVAELLTPLGDDALDLPDDLGSAPTPSTGRTCATCGAWIVDEDQHLQWHADYVPRASRMGKPLRILKRSAT